MENLIALSIGGQKVLAPDEIESGVLVEKGLPLIQNAVAILFIGAILLALFFIIWGGFKWMTSQGDKAKVETARKTLTYAILGLILTFFSFLIVMVIGELFNINLLDISSYTLYFQPCNPGSAC